MLERATDESTQAIALNRTTIYASARRHVRLGWHMRLAARIVPILLFLRHTLSLLRAMRCQTSPEYSLFKYGDANTRATVDFSGDGGFLYRLSSKLLFMESETNSCLAVGMRPSKTDAFDGNGSVSLLFPLFISLCLGQFVETLSCAVQGRPFMTETGMSVFEHSLAFAEAEGMLSNTLGLRPFNSSRSRTSAKLPANPDILKASFWQLNTPPENLLMGLISSLNHLSSHILGVFDKQHSFRLINTTIWGICFMTAFVWGFLSVRPESAPDNIILRFPTVCIVGFIPHLLILVGIVACSVIYTFAILLCLFSPPSDVAQLPFLQRLRWAVDNMQVNSQLSSIRLQMHQDFYTVLLHVGFQALTVASEAVYLQEWPGVSVARWTWLEEQRMRNIEGVKGLRSTAAPSTDYESIEEPQANARDQSWESGYAKQKTVSTSDQSGLNAPDGVGHLQRGGRWVGVWKFFSAIFWLLVGLAKLLVNKSLDKIGISARPNWLRITRQKQGNEQVQSVPFSQKSQPLKFWMLSEEGELLEPRDDQVDVESEIRNRLQRADENDEAPSDEEVNAKLYDWWKHGGWWGEVDGSGWFGKRQGGGSQASSVVDADDDTTSVISTTTSEDAWQSSSSHSSGRTTPTLRRPYPTQRSRSPTPLADHALDPTHLAALLDPRDSASRQEAKMLAHHLTAPTITTRSRYSHAQNFANARLLTSTRYRPQNSNIPASGPLSPDQEERLLEHLILSRRAQQDPPRSANGRAPNNPNSNSPAAADTDDTWRTGGPGMGSAGPQCVVCQSAPRTVLAWPCRCLSLCEDCRISLAMNNFGTCVCCRQDVLGFSRLFVP